MSSAFSTFLKKFFSTRLPLIGDSLIILSYSILIVKPIFYFFFLSFLQFYFFCSACAIYNERIFFCTFCLTAPIPFTLFFCILYTIVLHSSLKVTFLFPCTIPSTFSSFSLHINSHFIDKVLAQNYNIVTL